MVVVLHVGKQEEVVVAGTGYCNWGGGMYVTGNQEN